MRVGHNSGIGRRTLHMLSKCPAAKFHPYSPMHFHFQAISLFSELIAESAGLRGTQPTLTGSELVVLEPGSLSYFLTNLFKEQHH